MWRPERGVSGCKNRGKRTVRPQRCFGSEESTVGGLEWWLTSGAGGEGVEHDTVGPGELSVAMLFGGSL
jgi:hypothetical protein